MIMETSIAKVGFGKLILQAIAVVIAFFAEAKNLFHGVLVLILIDQLTGFLKALINRNFNWKKFNQVFKKVIMYLSAIIATFVFEKLLLESNDIFFSKAISSLIGFRELVSVYKNVSEATGKDYIKNAIKRFT